MAIRIKIPGMEIETDSADEAMEVVRQLSANREPVADSGEEERDDDDDDAHGRPFARKIVLGEHAKGMLKLLVDMQPEHGKPTTSIAGSLGVGGPKGLAAVTRQIRAWGRQMFGLGGNACIERFVSQEGISALKMGEALRAKIKGREKELLG